MPQREGMFGVGLSGVALKDVETIRKAVSVR
jgi:hypothetical protein